MLQILQNLPSLLLTAVGIMLMLGICHSHIPQVMTCPENNNDIAIFNSSFWLECENGRLIQKYCIIRLSSVIASCVPTNVVVEKQHSYNTSAAWKLVLPTFTDNTLQNPHCLKLNIGFYSVMKLFAEKQDCLQDYATKPVQANLTPCKIKDRNVFFLEDNAWFKCKEDGKAKIQKCVFKFPDEDQYWCMDRDRIVELFWGTAFYPEIKKRLRSKNAATFCKDLTWQLQYIYPHFKKELTICNANDIKYGQVPKTYTETKVDIPIEVKDTTDPFTGKDLYPQYINCKNADNAASMVIDKDAFWRECVNGRLENIQCAFHDKNYTSKYGCVSNLDTLNKIHEYYDNERYREAVVQCYMDAERTEPDCLQLRKDYPDQMVKFKGKGKGKECITLVYEVDENAEDFWCKIKSKKVYAVDEKNGWFTCKDGRLVLKKCVFKHGSEYFCLNKQKINAVWKDKPQAKNGSFCEAFTKEASQIYPNYVDELEPCEREGTDSETTSNAVSAEVKDDSKVKSEETNTETDETETDTETEEETDTETEEETDLIETKPYPGGRFGKILIKRCKEEPVAADDDCFYKCGRPYMCKTSNDQCLSFRAVEQMFNDSHSGKNKYSRYTNGPWSIKKYRKILNDLAYKEQDDIYETLEQYKSRNNPRLFQRLSEVYVLSLEEDKEDYFARKPSVSIRVGKWVTNVFAEDVIPIVEKFAPFYDNYISSYFEACPEEEEEEEEVDEYDGNEDD